MKRLERKNCNMLLTGNRSKTIVLTMECGLILRATRKLLFKSLGDVLRYFRDILLCIPVEGNPKFFSNQVLEGSEKTKWISNDDLCFRRNMLRVKPLSNGATVSISNESWHQKIKIALRACNINLLQYALSLLIKAAS